MVDDKSIDGTKYRFAPAFETREPVFEIDKETAEELLQFIGNQFVNHKYTKVHKLIRDLWVFVGKK